MPRYILALLLAALFVFALAANAPARLLGLVLPSDQVLLQGFNGTVWDGSASRSLVRTDAGYLHLGRLEWQLEPLSLILFAPRLTLDSHWGGQRISGDLVLRGNQSLDLHGIDARVSAELLRQFVPVGLSGTLSAQVQTLLLREGLPYAGSGRLVWQQGAWESPQGIQQLGSYALDYTQQAGQPLSAEILTLSGPVTAIGSLRLQDSSYEIDVLVSAENDMDQHLQQALSLIAAPEPDGYRVELSGQL